MSEVCTGGGLHQRGSVPATSRFCSRGPASVTSYSSRPLGGSGFFAVSRARRRPRTAAASPAGAGWRGRALASLDMALKMLVIVHRLLADGEQELFYAARRGTRVLYMSAPRPLTSTMAPTAASCSATSFTCLQETASATSAIMGVEGRMRRQTPTPPRRWRSAEGDADEQDGARAAPRQDPATATSPRTIHLLLTGAAKTNWVVTVSLYPLVKESVQLYRELTEVMAALIEQLLDMETADCERVHGVFCSLAKQIDELDSFYT
ncbi:putative clathrin assembly protein At1g03050 isoform X2 [Aegilops tauschii subsp. strangulata]